MSNKANAVGEARKYWGVIPVMPGQQLMETARQMEQLGYTGTFSYQVFGPPFIPNAVAAAATTRLQVASGIAIAGVRSPFETAMAAMDLDRISEGRFILGLGSSLDQGHLRRRRVQAHRPASRHRGRSASHY